MGYLMKTWKIVILSTMLTSGVALASGGGGGGGGGGGARPGGSIAFCPL